MDESFSEANLKAATEAMRNLFLAYQKAGFSKVEALELVKAHIAASLSKGP